MSHNFKYADLLNDDVFKLVFGRESTKDVMIEFLNQVIPDRTISDQDIQNRKLISRRYRNRRIGDFLKELKLVEGRNTGIPTIVRAMEINGSGEPVFLTDAERTYFTVILPSHKAFLETERIEPVRKEKKRRTITEIKGLILETLQASGNLSSAELANAMGYTKLTEAVSKAIKELMAEGQVVYSDPEHIRSRKQKICLIKKVDEE